MADQSFSKSDFANCQFESLDATELRALYEALRRSFHDAVAPAFRKNDISLLEWRNAMYAELIGENDKVVSEESLLGLGSEFFMQIEWLPGGRIVEGELIFDPIFEATDDAEDRGVHRLCDEKCRGFIFNFVREFGDLEYVNIGRVVASLSHRPTTPGRRDVYIAQVKQQGIKDEILKIIRMQKWGIREHLENGKELLEAIIQSDEYTEYILDRRLGCRQLGMNLPPQTTAKRISERYVGPRADMHDSMIWSPYFERDYIRGMATDKIPPQKLANPAFVGRFARLLGHAAASNLIVGRCDLQGRVVFDDGDEVLIENEVGMPTEIVVADQSGNVRRLSKRPSNTLPRTMPSRSTVAFLYWSIPRNSPRSTSMASSPDSPKCSWNIGNESERSTPSSSTGRATKGAVWPIVGSACWIGCGRAIPRNLGNQILSNIRITCGR